MVGAGEGVSGGISLGKGLLSAAGSGISSTVSAISTEGIGAIFYGKSRTKLESGIPYNSDCIIDELGWFEDIDATAEALEEFYEATGVQPYIILRDYDSTLTTDTAKENWAFDYYEDNFENENIFLYVYFADEDVDYTVGYMCYVDGNDIVDIMDDNAVDLFWEYIDYYWYDEDLSMDEVFIKCFNKTASKIM